MKNIAVLKNLQVTLIRIIIRRCIVLWYSILVTSILGDPKLWRNWYTWNFSNLVYMDNNVFPS